MDVLQETKPGPATGSTVAPPAPNQPATGAAGNTAPTTSAAQSVPLFGGNRGGKARKDGLAPGSPEALAADKKKDRDRKKKLRDAATVVAEPTPLPSAGAGVAGADATALPGVGPDGAVPVAPPVPWEAGLLSSLTDELIEAAEQNRVESFLQKCEEAKLTGKLVKELEADARFPKAAKIMLKQALPRLAAKYLNRAGISAEFQDELAVVTALVLIIKHNASASARLDELIETNRALLRKQMEEAEQAKQKAMLP